MTDPQDSIDQALQPTPPVAPPIVPPVVPPPLPELPVAPSVASVAVGDDTPLAFVTPPPATPPSTTPINTPPPTPLVPPEEPPKKGGKGKIIGVVIGFFLLLAGLGGGFYFYSNYLPASQLTIAGVFVDSLTKDQCNGCYNGGNLVWRKGACKVSGTCDGGNTQGQGHSTVVPCDTDGSVSCGACGGFCIIPIDKTCNEMGVIKCGESPVFGASCSKSESSQFFKQCSCGAETYYFDVEGICDSKDSKAAGTVNPLYYDTYGLCAVGKNGCSAGPGGSQISCDFSCDSNGCQCTSDRNDCQIYHWKCDRNDDLGRGCQDGTPTVRQSATFNASCGSEQIDVKCHGDNVAFRTKAQTTPCGQVTPSIPPTVPSPSPSPSPTYTMSCTSLTKNIAIPVIGSKITFTCAGVVTPTSAGTLSYRFRYSVNSGTVTELANKTTTTAELTIAACGTYSVECQACATLAGVLTCDPVWQGATAQ